MKTKIKIKAILSTIFLLLFLSIPSGFAQIINTIAGSGATGFSGDGGQAILASINIPSAVSLDAQGNIFIADRDNHRIRKVDALTGTITTIAGTGVLGYSGDGGPAINAKIRSPLGIVVDASGNVYIADNGNSRVRKIDAVSGIITTIAGTGTFGYSGDGGLAVNAEMKHPSSICLDAIGNIYFSDYSNDNIRKIDVSTGIITTVAGTGVAGVSPDGGLAINSPLNEPYGVAVDVVGNLYFAERNNNKIRKVDATTGVLTTIVGNGVPGSSGDGNSASLAQVSGPRGVFIDSSTGDIFIADADNNKIRKITALNGIITTIAGILAPPGFSGDGGLATNARLNVPSDVSVSSDGSVYIADSGNSRVRKITPTATEIIGLSQNETVVALFPNPTAEIINISGIKSESVVYVYDMSGKLVFEGLVSFEKPQIDISKLQQGLYTLIIETNQEREARKIILFERS